MTYRATLGTGEKEHFGSIKPEQADSVGNVSSRGAKQISKRCAMKIMIGSLIYLFCFVVGYLENFAHSTDTLFLFTGAFFLGAGSLFTLPIAAIYGVFYSIVVLMRDI